MSAKMKEVWGGGDDIIYSESCCDRQDIFYEGSEDEGYECPADRRRRYEEAGQRFLSGQIPSIMSASLEGPFDCLSGWINPWMSKRHKDMVRKSKEKARSQAHASQQSPTSIRRSRESTLAPPADECHLPSPESLKQAPQTQDHLFLGTEKFAALKKWQEKISRPSSNGDSFWNNGEVDASPQARKRRASRSEWLKKDSAKRRKSEVQKSRRNLPSQDEDIDELTTDMPSSSFDDGKSFNSPSRRQITRKVTRSFRAKKMAESDDELSPNKAAAATLSSPVSLKNASRMPSSNDAKTHFSDVLSSATAQSTPSHMRHVKMELQCSDKADFQKVDYIDNDAISRETKDMASATSELPVSDVPHCALFETEEDSSSNSPTKPVEHASHEQGSEEMTTSQEKIPISDMSKTSSNGDVTAARLSSSTPDSTPNDTPNSSLIDILSRFVPSSPWKRLSHLTSGSPISALRSACQVPGSQQGSLSVEPPAFSKPEEADKPAVDEVAYSNSNLAGARVHEEANNGDQSSRKTHNSDSDESDEEQTALELVESHTGVPPREHMRDADSQPLISASQQSPWAKSDELIVSDQHLPNLSRDLNRSEHVSQDHNVTEPQSPWVPDTKPCVQPGNLGNEKNIIPEGSGTFRATQPRPRTPEPQFFFKSFASFMSPSPDRSQNKTTRHSASKAAVRGDGGSLPSVLKGHGRQQRVQHRVSWASPLAEFHGSSLRTHDTAIMPTTDPLQRQRSPPPETPMADISKLCEDKFSKHFEAIAKRQHDGKPSSSPTGSAIWAESGRSAEPLLTDESLSAAGAAIHDDDGVDVPEEAYVSGNGEAERPMCERGSEEPMDMMEDMVREMGDFWDPWNVDSELEQARKNGSRLSLASA
ncbi:hypothetical protein E4U42_003051 [Claviceps africana]|uniref:Protamine P1 n=1 Tax=Claviceps africana TaxID=83212 RepID=A0A8K0NH38_9HYPO|nr:hypothetical protein E4U42_003051 [Claviceps africana]